MIHEEPASSESLPSAPLDLPNISKYDMIVLSFSPLRHPNASEPNLAAQLNPSFHQFQSLERSWKQGTCFSTSLADSEDPELLGRG